MDRIEAMKICEAAEPNGPCAEVLANEAERGSRHYCEEDGHCWHNVPNIEALEKEAFTNWGFDRCCVCGQAVC